MTRIAVLGGTFDPPHYGHLILAEQARDQLGVERVLWVPAAHPPHKKGVHYTDISVRLEMLRRAIQNNPSFSISLVDVNRAAPHYSVDTLSLLQLEHKHAEMYFLVGGDSLRDLPTWHDPAQLIELAHLVVMRRPGDALDFDQIEKSLPCIKDKVLILDSPLIDISASNIRRRVRQGRTIRYLVPDSVHDYIVSSQLY